ncbi:hypothetical protein F5B22DRAFT_630371 [Xylaria bambusicola]|uniref:uncharacterized protein n=1 Tax=Xylaria bambusicola TaxID=326684 RepID=UPI002007ADEC|nr:uncharacterized protein F5B22DRAFT_630371 [Xylaria bambusicola]KAI0503153.1 hypothetical protein F5B22DRAFT_630371 [Xylaria bambusicola]
MASRYNGSRYDGDSRRSRSRDRSPDRRSLYSDSGPRRSSAESRSNTAAFQANRDSFRDTLPRDTPRGPKALLDPPSGPRGGGYSGDFRGRGRGRGRGWREDSRDRGRDRDIDFRDRRDPPYRDDRSRERERPDWRDRDRDSFRGRRPSPRPRSPLGRDFRDSRDSRDGPLGVDADRARRGSRDGPLSAGSSSSDPPFVHSSYRGESSYRGGYGRGRGRGRGDWGDRGRGRPFYEDRDRYVGGPPFRSRSQEGRFRDRDDRERENNRYLDADLRPRDPRDDRDTRDRETRVKLDRTSHEPPTSTKDVSPPPVAPAAPSFGSVPNRTALTSEMASATGKAPPTGPRALKEDRPPPVTASPLVDTRAPPTGPSKPAFERSPPIPSGPRSQRPGPSSMQWINPNLAKHRVPESPKPARSSSFAQSRPAGIRGDSVQSDQPGDSSHRPRSSDGKMDLETPRTEGNAQEIHSLEPGEVSRVELRPQSAGSSAEREKRKEEPSSTKTHTEASEEAEDIKLVDEKTAALVSKTESTANRRPTLKVPVIRVSYPEKQSKESIMDQSSDSDDEEIGDMIESGMIEAEKELKQLKPLEDSVCMDPIIRYALLSLEAVNQVAIEPEGLEAMIGPIPKETPVLEKTDTKQDLKDSKIQEQTGASDTSLVGDNVKQPQKESDAVLPSLIKEPAGPSNDVPKQPEPSIEQESKTPVAPKSPPGDQKLANDGDTVMEDAMPESAIPEVQPRSRVAVPTLQGEPVLPLFEEAQIESGDASKRESCTPSPPEDEDETDIEDVDLHSIAIVREHMQTPPLDSLPYFDVKPWDKDKGFMRSMNTQQPDVSAFILQRLEDDAWTQHVRETQLKKTYGANYVNYIRFTMSDEPVAVKSREKFSCVVGTADLGGHTKPGVSSEPKPENTRRSRYASERDLERVLEESRKIEDDKRERQEQAERERHRTEKEAVIPRQYQTEKERENEFYSSNTGLVQPEKIVATWEVLPPVDNFTKEESEMFEKAYLEFPKQWGRVSEPLAHRDFGTAIQFYYLKKEKDELNLKEKLKRQPKKRKRGGRGKTRSSALVSELGNGDNDNEEGQETGENGERRRPRRAAAPTFNSEATPATDGESGTPAGTPGRRGAAATRADGTEKPKRGRRAKDKDQKQPRVAVTLAAAPTPGPTPSPATKGNRSRSASRAQNLDWIGQQTQDDMPRIPSQYELAPNLGQSAPGMPIQSYPQSQPLVTPERGVPPSSMADAMAPPPLRPEPPPQPPVAVLDIGQPPPPPDRKSGGQPSSYWSVPEAAEFPSLLKSFGSDWAAIAAHMRTKTAVMVKNYYTRRKDSTDWEAIVKEADDRKHRGEKRPPPPVLATGTKKRYDTSSNRPLAAADAVMEDVPAPKMEHPPTSQSMNTRFNVPIAAQPQPPPVAPSPFAQAAHLVPQVGSQPISQATVTQTMSPVSRPLRAPLPFPDRERETFPQQATRTPLVSKPPHPAPSAVPEPPVRHPLPGSLPDLQPERPKSESKPPKEPVRQPERQQMRVKQEPDLAPQQDFYGAPPAAIRGPPSRVENRPLSSRPVEAPRNPAQAPQAPYSVIQHQTSRGFMNESNPSSPVPSRSMLPLTRPLSRASATEPFNPSPAQRTPPSVTPAPPRAPKTSSLMALLNDDPPAPPPKRVAEVPAAPKLSSTPPPHANLSRPPPPPPPPPSHVRRDSSLTEAQPYGYSRGPPPPPPPSSMPSLKPYTASPQAQPLSAPRHMPMDGGVERDYYGNRPRQYPPTAASSPQNTPHYQVPAQPPQVQQYQSQTSYPYGAPIQPQPPNASSPPPQYAPHQSMSRSHEPSSSARETGWPAQSPGHPIQQQPHPQQQHQHQQIQHHQQPPPQQHQQQQQPPQQPTWSSHPPQPPKSTQPQPTQSAWAAQHASAPKPPQPSSSVPPQSSWVNTPPPPRGHDPMALRDNFPLSRMQTPLQVSYPPSSRAPEPPPPQGPAGYARYTNTPSNAPIPGRDPRDPGPPRSYTPVSYESRVYPSQGPPDPRDAHLREQQAQQPPPSVLQQQLRPQDRHIYDRPPPDRYGR